jgi:biopolymer transport protein TolQ
MEIDLVELWENMPALVKMVVIVLTIQALATIYVLVDRLILLLGSTARSRKFAAEAGSKLAAGRFEEVLQITKKHDKSHLANFIETGVSVFLDRLRDGHGRTKAAVFATRALERKGENLSTSLNRGLNILASTGSTAPFIGLLGTVLGILNAFRLIGDEDSGGMSTIGPAISEALVVTGYGLLVAIPAVLIFNWLSARIAKYEAGLANAGSELVDQLEADTSTGEAVDEEASEGAPAPAVA